MFGGQKIVNNSPAAVAAISGSICLSSQVAQPACWRPAALYANGVSGTQSPLCGSGGSTLACCDHLNRGPVCPSVSGTCVLTGRC